MLDTYCDNKYLKSAILKSPQPKGKLYAHELALVFYCSIGQIKTNEPSFAGCISLQLRVDYPICLLYSLVQRGYIRKSTYSENIQFFKTRDMQTFVKNHGQKGSSKHDELVNIIRNNFTETEVRRSFPSDYYVPTAAGEEELVLSGYTIKDAYDGWPVADRATSHTISEADIHMTVPSVKAIQVDTSEDEFKCTLLIDTYSVSIWARIFNLPQRSNVEIVKNGRAIARIDNVDSIRILHRRNVLIFETSQSSSGLFLSIGFDVVAEKVLFREQIKRDELRLSHSIEEYVESKVEKNIPLAYNGMIDYYVSTVDPIVSLMLEELLPSKCSSVRTSVIKNFLPDDSTHNLIISIPEQENALRSFVQFLARQRYISSPSIKGITIHKIASYLHLQEEISTQATQTGVCLQEDNLLLDRDSVCVVLGIKELYGELNSLEEFVWKFPSQLLKQPDVFRYYVSPSADANDMNWEYAGLHETELQKVYNSYLLEMRERNLIPTRWVSELSLFFLIREHFPDAIYQYHCPWLGRQSFDIFIPSQNVAIEYQGKQHYEPVDIFGGIDGFEQTIKRDKQKRVVSAEHLVKVIDWKYDIPVDSNTVHSFIKQFVVT